MRADNAETISLADIRNGSKDVFEAVVNRYMKDAYYIALGFVGNAEDALDLSQEAFYRAYKNRKRLRTGGKFFPWFYQILKNLCFSHLRKKKIRRQHSLDAFEGQDEAIEESDVFSPNALAETDETKRNVWNAIGKLDQKHREVIILRHFRNLSYEKMAEILFCNKGTITSRLYYARKRLKELLDKEKGGQ